MELLLIPLAIIFLIVPFVISSRLHHIRQLLKKQNEILQSIAERANETNKGLQYFIDRDKPKQ